MKTHPRLLTTMTALCAAIIAILPLHGFLTVWGSSLVGHYTALRLWKEYVLAVLVVLAGVWLVRTRPFRRESGSNTGNLEFLRRNPVLLVTIAYGAVIVLSAAAAWIAGAATFKAAAYGLLLDTRFLVFFLIVWLVSCNNDWIVAHARQLLFVPAVVVVVFGLLQFTVLPPDFLRHFGYGPDTIAVLQTVDQKQGYQRIQSTLRGANPLGAYLIIIITGVIAMASGRRELKRGRYIVMLGMSVVALVLTFSRSAWLGALAAVGWLVWTMAQSPRARRALLVTAATGAILVGLLAFSLRTNDVVQNTLFHTDEHSLSAANSNQGHSAATKQGVLDISHQPFGRGVGTAGPASAYNTTNSTSGHGSRLAENYYLQIGQEAGLLGMGLFIALNVLVGRELWRRRGHVLGRALLASLIGICVVNMLSHAWTDDTLSYIWWGLAGAVLALPKKAKEYN